jgi:hypothetical protein
MVLKIMKQQLFSRILTLFIMVLFLGTGFVPISSSRSTHQTSSYQSTTITGQILFSPMDGSTTYLIDYTGEVNHTWESDYLPGISVYWLGNGTILRTIKTTIVGFGGSGGGIQKVQWDGTITWDYRYDTDGDLSHHDIKPLPNGNVLLIAWETKTRAEAIEAGRNPDTFVGNDFMPVHILEIHQTGPKTGSIVWEWHVWDHLIQNYDPSQNNYGVVSDHPELININTGTNLMKSDWLHTNSIDYNAELDQIILSIHNLNEIWVIDHSTTMEEAAGHTGGNSGKGGDILYRWGNPQNYGRGSSNDQKLFGQHDATWIKPGCPGAGHILVFNNGLDRPAGDYSTVDEIAPPIDENGHYYLAQGAVYGPTSTSWSYIGNPPTSFYARGISGAERLKDGDTLICNGVEGRFFEVTPDGTTVWEYINPYPTPGLNNVFKIEYIPPVEPTEGANLHCNGSLSWSDVQLGQTVNGSFQVENIGDPGSLLDWTIDTSSITWGTWTFTPLSGQDLTPEDGPVTVQVSVTAPNEKNKEFDGYLRVENTENPDDFDVVPVYLKTQEKTPLVPYRWTLLHEFFTVVLKWFQSIQHLLTTLHEL